MAEGSSARHHRHVNEGYEEQLAVETVVEWCDGYIPYSELMATIDAVAVARGADDGPGIQAAIDHADAAMREAINRSAAFFAREMYTIQRRFTELGGQVSVPVPAPSGAEFLPERHYTHTGTSADASHDAPAPTRGTSVAARSAAAAKQSMVPLNELAVVVEKLIRFAEVQSKTVRHWLDSIVVAAPPGSYDRKILWRLFEASDLATMKPVALATLEDVRTRLDARKTGTGGAMGAAAGASAAEAYEWTIKWRWVALALVVLVLIRVIPILKDDPEAHTTASIIGCVAVLWITEAIPFFAAALFIPLLAVPMKAVPNKNHHDTGVMLLGAMFDHTQTLVLGGLCLGKAIAKHQLERQIARYCLRPVASRPWLYTLVVMFASVILCAVISNVAAPVLVMSMVQPSLWELDATTGAPQAILLAVAFACNFGGMLTPIASPQNAVAQSALGSNNISFVTWLGAAFPIVFLGVLSAWAIITLVWKPFERVDYIPIPLATAAIGVGATARAGSGTTGSVAVAKQPATAAYGSLGDGAGGQALSTAAKEGDEPPGEERLLPGGRPSTPTGVAIAPTNEELEQAAKRRRIEVIAILVLLFVTVVLWCVPQGDFLGDTGVVALIPIVVLFGVGILKKADFNSLSWHLIFLLSGGNMLGLISRESRLLEIVINGLRPFLESHSTYQVVAVLIICVAFVTTFVSHTVASLLLMPVIVEVSQVNPGLPSAQSLVFLSVIMCSGSMAFPITSFPNVNSLLTESADGKPYLLARHFLLPGLVMSSLVLAQLTTYMVEYTKSLMPR